MLELVARCLGTTRGVDSWYFHDLLHVNSQPNGLFLQKLSSEKNILLIFNSTCFAFLLMSVSQHNQGTSDASLTRKLFKISFL